MSETSASAPRTSHQRIGIDVGGTKIEGSLIAVSPATTPSVLASTRIPARSGEANVAADILSLVTLLRAEAASHTEKYGPLLGVGIGTPGKVDSSRGTVENIANLNVHHLDLSREIGSAAHLPVRVENDVNAAALGAAALLGTGGGAASSATPTSSPDVIAFLNLGTGLAAGILRDGILDAGFSGVVGEIGHVPVEPHRLACPCGQTGCLETMASGGAVSRMWPQDDPAMPAIIAKAHDVTSPEHDAARDVLKNVVSAIADAIDILAVTIDPRLIIVGGGMAKTGQPLLDEIAAELNHRAASSPFIASLNLPARLHLAPSDQPTGAVGAALSAEQL
jgi:predicted NBD/HSP70 family sugar kinase